MILTILRSYSIRRRMTPGAIFFLMSSMAVAVGFAADAPANTDVLVFTNGDQLTGKLISSATAR